MMAKHSKLLSGLSKATNAFNKSLAKKLLEIADYEMNVDRNRFKSVAFRRAARLLRDYPTQIKNGTEARKLKGIGQSIANTIDEYIKTGRIKRLEDFKKQEGSQALEELTRVYGIGPAAAENFYNQGIRSIDDLRLHKDKLNHHQKIGLKYLNDLEQRIPREEMLEIENLLHKEIESLDSKYTVTLVGSFRRGESSSGDVDVLVTHPEYDSASKLKRALIHEKENELLRPIIQKLEKAGFLKETVALGDQKYMGICQLDETKVHHKIDIRLMPKDEYYFGILHMTGSQGFNEYMRRLAKDEGYKLNEYSLRKLNENGEPGTPIHVNSEEEIFEKLNMEYKKPEERSI